MARDISGRLGRLHARRHGTDRLDSLSESERLEVLAKSLVEEGWQKRAATSKPYTRYALGAMQEVGPDYTRISLQTAQRVGGQLQNGLAAAGIAIELRLQGSVPLNVHIRGVSDVDLLNLETSFLTYARMGARSQAGLYFPAPGRSSIEVLSNLRREAERILKEKYPAAKVDCSGGKAINISGGSLARPIDVVPSHWFDSIGYQSSGQEHDRGVTILDKKVPTTIDNWPFLHIKRIGDRDVVTLGGLRKAIRLCKNVKSDAEGEGKDIPLPSFDIAAAMYHANLDALRAGYVYELAILAETQRHLDWLTQNEIEAKKLMTPDGSRPIFNTPAKLAGLRQLSLEMDDLLTEVAKEQEPMLGSSPSWWDSRRVLAERYIPAA